MKGVKGNRPCVIITGVGGGSVGHQILYAVGLMEKKYRIVAVDADPFAFGLYSADARYVVPIALDDDYLGAIMEIVEREQVDALLLGCTHYPLLKDLIQTRIGKRTILIDSSAEVASDVKNFVDSSAAISLPSARDGENTYYVSDLTSAAESTAHKIFGRKIQLIKA